MLWEAWMTKRLREKDDTIVAEVISMLELYIFFAHRVKLLTSAAAAAVIRSARFGGRKQGRDRDLNEWVERKGER